MRGRRTQGQGQGLWPVASPLLNAPVETWTLGLGNAVAGSAVRRQGHRVAVGRESASRAWQFAHLGPTSVPCSPYCYEPCGSHVTSGH